MEIEKGDYNFCATKQRYCKQVKIYSANLTAGKLRISVLAIWSQKREPER